MSILLEQLQAQAAAEQEKVNAEKAKIAAEQKAVADSSEQVNSYLVAALENGFEVGSIDPRVMKATLERSEDPEFITMVFTNRALTDSLYGVQKTTTGFSFNDETYKSVTELQLAVENFLGVDSVPNFRALLRGVITGSPLVEPRLKRLQFAKPAVYDKTKLQVNDALYIQQLEGGF